MSVSLYDRIFARRRAWHRLMLGDDKTPNGDARIVLADLARFCRANRSTAVYSPVRGHMDPIASAKADGRREVWLRIAEYLNLDDRYITNLKEDLHD
jgi:hypothetical protein